MVDVGDGDMPSLAKMTFAQIEEDDERVSVVSGLHAFPNSMRPQPGFYEVVAGDWRYTLETELLEGDRFRVTITLHSYLSQQRASTSLVLRAGQRLVFPTTLPSSRGHVAVVVRSEAVHSKAELFEVLERRAGLATELE